MRSIRTLLPSLLLSLATLIAGLILSVILAQWVAGQAGPRPGALRQALTDYAGALRGRLMEDIHAVERLADRLGLNAEPVDVRPPAVALDLVKDLPALSGIAWIDPSLQLRWTREPDAASSSLVFPAVERRAAATRSPLDGSLTLVTRTGDLGNGRRGLRVYAPVVIQGRIQGLLAAAIATEDLSTAVAVPGFKDRFDVTVYEDRMPIFGTVTLPVPQNGRSSDALFARIAFYDSIWTVGVRHRPGDWSPAKLAFGLGALAAFAAAMAVLAGAMAWQARSRQKRAGEAAADAGRRQQDAEDRYRLLCMGAGVGIWDWNVRPDRLYWSQRVDSLLGIEKRLLAPKFADFEAALHEDDRARAQKALDAHFESDAPFDITVRLRCGTRAFQSFRLSGQAVYGADDRPVRMAGTLVPLAALGAAKGEAGQGTRAHEDAGLRDLALAAATATIVASNADDQPPVNDSTGDQPADGTHPTLDMIFDAVPTQIWIKDDTGRILRVNRAAARLIGKSVADVEGQLSTDLFPENGKGFVEEDQEVLRSGETKVHVLELPVEEKDESWFLRIERVPFTDPKTQRRFVVAMTMDVTQERRIERDLLESQERYELAIKGSGAGLWDIDLTTGDMRWSPRIYDMLQLDPETFSANLETLHGLMHPDDLPAVIKARKAHLEHGERYESVFRVRRADGAYVWIHSRGEALRTGDGKPLRMVGSLHDVSDAKRREVEWAAFVDASSDGVWDVDFIGNRLFISPRFWTILGHGDAQPTDDFSAWRSFLLEEDLPKVEAAMDRHIASKGKEPFSLEARFKHKNGSVVTVLSRGRVVDWGVDGKPARMLIMHTDLTAMREAEAGLLERDRRFATAVNGLSVGLYDWIDVTRDECWWSPLFFKLLGYEAGEIEPLVSTFRSLLHPDDVEPTFALVDTHLTKKTPFQIEYRVRHKTEGYRWFLGTGQAIWDQADKPKRMIGSIMDIHARKTADLMKSEFVSTVSHELRSPMTSVMGAVGLVRSGRLGAMTPQIQELLDIAHANGDRLIQLLNDILDMEKIEAGQIDFDMEVHALHPLISRACQEAEGSALERLIRLEQDLGADDPQVWIDADRFGQVMANLLSNAIKFSENETTVRIFTETRGTTVRVGVADKGPGIPAEYRPHVFNKFSQADGSDARRSGGTGLGLSIAKAIVETFAGTIGFETAEGHGTTFHVDLPLHAAPERVISPPQKAPPADALFTDKDGGAKILLVEHDQGIVRVFEQLIGDLGEVRAVSSRARAHAVLSTEHVDLVVLEPNLPDGYGLDLAERFCSGPSSAPALIIHASGTVPAADLPPGAKAFAKARISSADLRDVAREMLGLAGPATPAREPEASHGGAVDGPWPRPVQANDPVPGGPAPGDPGPRGPDDLPGQAAGNRPA